MLAGRNGVLGGAAAIVGGFIAIVVAAVLANLSVTLIV